MKQKLVFSFSLYFAVEKKYTLLLVLFYLLIICAVVEYLDILMSLSAVS